MCSSGSHSFVSFRDLVLRSVTGLIALGSRRPLASEHPSAAAATKGDRLRNLLRSSKRHQQLRWALAR